MKVTLLGLVLALISIGCTNFDTDPLGERMDENFEGNLTHPGGIDPAGDGVFTFSVFSDTHIGSPGGNTLEDVLNKSKNEGDSFCLIAGDVTDTGAEGQYLTLKEILGRVALPYRLALGNHDIFFNGWEHFKKHIGKSVYSFDADNLHVAVIDTANGVIGERQLEWLENDLSQSSAAHKVVLGHFPAWNGRLSGLYKLASDEEAAILKDIFHRTGVDIYFSGHWHGYEEATLGGVKYIVTGGANSLIDVGNEQHFFRVRINGETLTTEKVLY